MPLGPAAPAMQRLSDDEAGLSEIVGALMLVMVVVIAAGSFGAFFLEKQKRDQAQEKIEADRAAERIEIKGMKPVAAGLDWETITFTFANAGVEKVRISVFAINGAPVQQFTLTNADGSKHGPTGTQGGYYPWRQLGSTLPPGTLTFDGDTTPTSTDTEFAPADVGRRLLDLTDSGTLDPGTTIAAYALSGITLNQPAGSDVNPHSFSFPDEVEFLDVQPRERLMVTVRVSDTYAFYGLPPDLAVASPLKLAVETAILNTFEKDFIPPTAVALYQETSTTGVLLLDGGESAQPTEAGRIVSWTWTVDDHPSVGQVTFDGTENVVGVGTTFTAADIGRTFADDPVTFVPPGTTIVAVSDATHITLSANAAVGGPVDYTFPACAVQGLELHGRVVRAALANSGDECDVTLTVSDSNGLTATDAFWYQVP